jgi:hypothetical protein
VGNVRIRQSSLHFAFNRRSGRHSLVGARLPSGYSGTRLSESGQHGQLSQSATIGLVQLRRCYAAVGFQEPVYIFIRRKAHPCSFQADPGRKKPASPRRRLDAGRRRVGTSDTQTVLRLLLLPRFSTRSRKALAEGGCFTASSVRRDAMTTRWYWSVAELASGGYVLVPHFAGTHGKTTARS